ncbi:hypothetical protein [Synechococcus sp. A15-24]|uniref:hypothetical protein n=1 Tax=Synechococcus sp. A15-24 TaxID=1050635 RepID=UPI00164811C1|nr:hypothetical protein [Synechococcus sp. A15-24]
MKIPFGRFALAHLIAVETGPASREWTTSPERCLQQQAPPTAKDVPVAALEGARRTGNTPAARHVVASTPRPAHNNRMDSGSAAWC